jgi:hypothetical protein
MHRSTMAPCHHVATISGGCYASIHSNVFLWYGMSAATVFHSRTFAIFIATHSTDRNSTSIRTRCLRSLVSPSKSHAHAHHNDESRITSLDRCTHQLLPPTRRHIVGHVDHRKRIRSTEQKLLLRFESLGPNIWTRHLNRIHYAGNRLRRRYGRRFAT